MNVAEWIIVAILSITLLAFLILGIILFIKLIGLTKEAEKVVVESQDIAKNASGIVSNVRGMTSFGGAIQLMVDKYITSKLKEKPQEPRTTKPKESKETTKKPTAKK